MGRGDGHNRAILPRKVLQVLIPLVGALLLVGGLIALGRIARRDLSGEPRFTIPFQAIDCPAPPGSERVAFLGEVQYLSQFAEEVHVYDDDLPPRLVDAFRRHPWVRQVEEVRLLPPDRVTVHLTFRRPVLAVSVAETQRVVDAEGVLLPPTAPPEGLPILKNPVDRPTAPAGKRWDDPNVATAVAVARLLEADQARLGLTGYEVAGEGVILHAGKSRIVWGHVPGTEPTGEMSGAEKRQRLRELVVRHGTLDLERAAPLDLRSSETSVADPP